VYSQGQETQGSASQTSEPSSGEKPDDGTVEGEFREV